MTSKAKTSPGLLSAIPLPVRIGAVLIVFAFSSVATFFYANRAKPKALAEREPLLLADFENRTNEASWDSILKPALVEALRLSPYLNPVPDEQVRETLRQMNRSETEPITRKLGRDICERRKVRALLTGTLVKLGLSYAITLEVINVQRDETLARVIEEANGRGDVEAALRRATRILRGKLGESAASLQRYDTP